MTSAVIQTFLPASLLRSLQRDISSNERASSSDASSHSTLDHGVLLGTKMAVQDEHHHFQHVAIWGFLRFPIDDDMTGQSFDRNLPGGITRIGNYRVIYDNDIGEDECEVVALDAANKYKDDGNIVLLYQVSTQKLRMFECNDGKATSMKVTVLQCHRARDFHRAVGFALVRCVVDLHVMGDKRTLLHHMEKHQAATCDADSFYVRASVMKNKKDRAYCVLNSRGEDAMSYDTKPVDLELILPEIDVNETAGEMKRKKKNGKKHKKDNMKTPLRREVQEEDTKMGVLPSLEYGDIATIDLLVNLGPVDGSAVAVAPVVTIPTSSVSKSPTRGFSAYCDSVVVVRVDSPLVDVLELLRNQLHCQLTEIIDQLKDAPEAVSCVAMHQFPLIGAAFPLTVVSNSTGSESSNDDTMDDAKTLENLHRAFLQPLNQYLFRVSRGCSLAQQGEWLATSDVLYNVHEGIPSSNMGSHCESALVSGFYGYYHYLQQGVNDKGWGCAYRSLQTLASWLFLQHYTQERILLHDQIQNVLVKIGDKPAHFQGSTKWIGSLEVGYVLDELFGVTFRTLSVSSGGQLPEAARELLHHFETQGTPVMMGGGQLAFTLLGVTYDPNTTGCAFLTLDPHYTGDEDLATIQNQTVMLHGYKAVPCSWRKSTTFANSSFYNLCLPQRPNVGF